MEGKAVAILFCFVAVAVTYSVSEPVSAYIAKVPTNIYKPKDTYIPPEIVYPYPDYKVPSYPFEKHPLLRRTGYSKWEVAGGAPEYKYQEISCSKNYECPSGDYCNLAYHVCWRYD